MTTPEGQRARETMHTPWLPCPFCGGTDIRSDAHRFAGTGEHRGETIYSMCCGTCGATFPNRYRHELLKECWNRRVNSHSTLTTESTRLTERVKVLEAAAWNAITSLGALLRDPTKEAAPSDFPKELNDGDLECLAEAFNDLRRAHTTLTHGEGK